MAARHSIISEATDAGFLGAITVALWFLLYDSITGRPLRTPSVLGQLFLLGEPNPDTNSVVFSAVVMYTVVHFLVFLAFSFLVATLVRAAATNGFWRFAVVVLFVVFELFFYIFLRAFSPEVANTFPGWTIAVGNLLATGAMGLYFWKRYPEIQEKLEEVPLGA
jgi:hypothetical protein